MPVISREKIEKRSLGYWLTKQFVDFLFKCYYPKKVIGKEKIDFNEILIFATNHQNTLIDALALLTMRRWQPVFLARADIFRKPFIEKILTFLKIMPVYRIRDGYENLQLNNNIFRKTIDVLNNRNGLVILPEGNHEGFRRLRQLKKGIARIAFQAIEDSGGKMNIKIVPVGLEYSHYRKFGSPIQIRLGEPINVLDFYPKYLENNAKGVNKLIEELSIRIKNEMIHIEDDVFYYEYEIIRQQGAFEWTHQKKQRANISNLFNAGKKFVDILNELKESDEDEFFNILNVTSEYQENMRYARIETPLNPRKMSGFSLLLKIPALIATLPVFLYGFINNLIPLGIIHLISSKIKDPQFVSSVRFVSGLVLFPLFFIIQTVIFALVVKNGWWTLFYFIALPSSGLLMMLWRKLFFNVEKHINILYVRLFKNDLYREIKNNLKTIGEFCRKYIN